MRKIMMASAISLVLLASPLAAGDDEDSSARLRRASMGDPTTVDHAASPSVINSGDLGVLALIDATGDPISEKALERLRRRQVPSYWVSPSGNLWWRTEKKFPLE